MSPSWPLFVASVVALVVLLVVDFVTGKRGWRAGHITLSVVTIADLTLAILQAEAIGRGYKFGEPIRTIHLTLAKTAAGWVLLVVGSGLWLAFKNRGRKLHLAVVIVFLVLAAAASTTGVLLFTDATPK